jgi:hypothetical protein
MGYVGERRTIAINLEQVKDVLISHLYAIGALQDSEDVEKLDIPVEVNKYDEIELELEIVLNMRNKRTFE